MTTRTTWGEWTGDFQAALDTWHEMGGAMLYQFVDGHGWLAWDGDEIATMVRDVGLPVDLKAITIEALEAGGLSPEQIAEEMKDWQS
jgi:hypothetical protein